MSFFRGSSRPKSKSPTWEADSLPFELPRKPRNGLRKNYKKQCVFLKFHFTFIVKVKNIAIFDTLHKCNYLDTVHEFLSYILLSMFSVKYIKLVKML